jgi:hypothetical protein
VRGYARLGDQASMTGNARLLEYATVDGRGTVSGEVLIKGFGEVHLQPGTELTGGAICGEDLEVHFLGCEQEKIPGGMIYGYLNKDLIRKEVLDNRWLYAHWDFNERRGQVLRDANADCAGVIRGSARFAKVEGRGVMAFDGKTYALVEGHIADTRGVTFDLQLEWAGGANGQRVFEFGDLENSLYLALEQDGRPTFVIRRGTERAVVQGTRPLTQGRWARLTVTLKDSTARIFIDGTLTGENRQFGLVPEDVRARAGRIGAGLTGTGFSGHLDDVAVFRTGFESIADVPVVSK